MNKVILVGRLVRDPELRKTNTDISVVQFAIAVDRIQRTGQEKKTDFINCVAWRNLADNLARFMRKGSLIGVEGQLQVRSYEDQNGAKRNITEVICDNIQFLESKNARENSGYSDINSYDIPDYQDQYEQPSFDQFSQQRKGNPFEIPSTKSKEEPEDPFAKLISKNNITDDDLPFN